MIKNDSIVLHNTIISYTHIINFYFCGVASTAKCNTFRKLPCSVGSVLVRKIPKTLFDFFVNRKFSSDSALKFFQKSFSARKTKL